MGIFFRWANCTHGFRVHDVKVHGGLITTSVGAQAKLAIRYQTRHTESLKSDTGRLATGKRINKAADDAARLAISTKLNAHTRGKGQAMRNTNDAISLVQMAEGGLGEISNTITRLRELAIQSASDSITDSERYLLDIETQRSKETIDQISGTNMLFGHQLLKGQSKTLDLQIDSGSGGYSRVQVGLDDLAQSTDALGINSIRLDSKNGARQALEYLDQAMDKVSGTRAKLGSLQKRFISTTNKLQTDIQSFKAADSRLVDTDFAQTTADLAAANIKSSVTTSVQGQANFDMKQALKLIG